jgi:hypothetical protein
MNIFVLEFKKVFICQPIDQEWCKGSNPSSLFKNGSFVQKLLTLNIDRFQATIRGTPRVNSVFARFYRSPFLLTIHLLVN